MSRIVAAAALFFVAVSCSQGRSKPTPDEVKAFLTEGGRGKGTDTEVNSRIRVTTRQGEVTLYIETCDQDHNRAVLHRSYIAR